MPAEVAAELLAALVSFVGHLPTGFSDGAFSHSFRADKKARNAFQWEELYDLVSCLICFTRHFCFHFGIAVSSLSVNLWATCPLM